MSKITNYEENLICVARFEMFIDYIYPILINLDNRNRELKTVMLISILEMPQYIYEAAHTDQISKVRILDARLATIKSYVRRLSKLKTQKKDKKTGKLYLKHVLLPNQTDHASLLLSEVGKLIFGWLDRLDPKRVKAREARKKQLELNQVDDLPLEVLIGE